jgi:cation-transporting ATPase E
MPVIIANTFIGIIQEIRSKRVLDKLTVLNAPKANVIRDEKEMMVDAVSLVVGDLVIFGAGNQVCADAVVTEGEVQVNESLITGESDEITKRIGDNLLSGSFIVSGKCNAVLEKVGNESYVAKLTMEAKKTRKGEQSEMMRSLNKLVKTIGILLIPIGLALFSEQHWILGSSVKDSTISSIAALVGMIPEGLYLLASVALVVSVMVLAKKKVIVHEMACIETLARVNVLCVDKTGTITENKMEVNEVIPLDNYRKADYGSLHEMLGEFVSSMTNDNATMEALKLYFNGKSTGGGYNNLNAKRVYAQESARRGIYNMYYAAGYDPVTLLFKGR